MSTLRLIAILSLLGVAAVRAAAPAPVALVNPLQGTDSNSGYSHGNEYPAIALPFPMNTWAPYTQPVQRFLLLPLQRQAKIRGIRQTHQPSPWIGDYAAFSLMPVSGKLVGEGRRPRLRLPPRGRNRPAELLPRASGYLEGRRGSDPDRALRPVPLHLRTDRRLLCRAGRFPRRLRRSRSFPRRTKSSASAASTMAACPTTSPITLSSSLTARSPPPASGRPDSGSSRVARSSTASTSAHF